VSSLSPGNITATSTGFTLTVNGTNFISTSTVQWNGSTRSTIFVSSTQLTASITTADITAAGTAQITVTSPTPGGGTSNAIAFTVNNPAPTVSSFSPATAVAGTAAFTLTVNGTGFVSTSTVQWNGSARSTTFVSSTELTAAIKAADISAAGTAQVTVTNPTPGGGSSSAATLTIYAATLIVADSSNNRVLLYNLPVSTGASATTVLGQPNLTTSGVNVTATGMSRPEFTAQDVSGDIFISDWLLNRVEAFTPPFTNGMSASLVLGQASFTTSTGTLGASALHGPTGVAFDGNGNLWVADLFNCRVLEYQPPFSTGMSASIVIGQSNFTSGAAIIPVTQTSILYPQAIVFDASGNLWVADYARVLQYQPPFSTGMAASLVLGQPNFTSSTATTTQSGMNYPFGLAIDSSGNVWVADSSNNRVLEFVPPFTSGMTATLVLGQSSFTASTAASPPTQSSFSAPGGMAFDSAGNLYVTDSHNNRTMVFSPPFSTGMNASAVLGQASFTSATATTTASGQSSPLAATVLP
jgi:sugar lactone lactonase YvrE